MASRTCSKLGWGQGPDVAVEEPVESVDDDDDSGGDVDVDGAVVVVVGHDDGTVVPVLGVAVVDVVALHGAVVVVVLEGGGLVVVVVGGAVGGLVVVVVGGAVVGLVVGVVGGVVVEGGVVVGGRVVVVVPPGPGLVGAATAVPVVAGLPGRVVATLPGAAVVPGAATAPVSCASVETWRVVDVVPAPEPRMLLKASSWEEMERPQFTPLGSSPPLNHLRARMKSPQRSVSSRTLGLNPTAMLTAAMS
jgi:hypothetical protein